MCEEAQVLASHLHLEARGPSNYKPVPAGLQVMTASATAASNAGVPADTANLIETVWSKLKYPVPNAATEVCGLSKNHQWRLETWWWNERVDEAIQEKCAWFKAYKNLKEGKMAEAKEAVTAYKNAKHVATHVVGMGKFDAEKEEFATASPDDDGVSRLAKQMDRTNQDVIGKNCVHNDAGELALTNDAKMKAWINVEFKWPSNELSEPWSCWNGC